MRGMGLRQRIGLFGNWRTFWCCRSSSASEAPWAKTGAGGRSRSFYGCLALYYQGRPVVIMEVEKAVRSIPEGTHARHGLNTVPCA
jgi:hypothetical protein